MKRTLVTTLVKLMLLDLGLIGAACRPEAVAEMPGDAMVEEAGKASWPEYLVMQIILEPRENYWAANRGVP